VVAFIESDECRLIDEKFSSSHVTDKTKDKSMAIKTDKAVKAVKTDKAIKTDKPVNVVKVNKVVKIVQTEKAKSRRLSKSQRKHIRRMKEAARKPDPVQNQPTKSPRKPKAAVQES
jgi:hypothetical protein